MFCVVPIEIYYINSSECFNDAVRHNYDDYDSTDINTRRDGNCYRTFWLLVSSVTLNTGNVRTSKPSDSIDC